jgi:hypothetical protein
MMSTHRERWSSAAGKQGQSSLPDQIVLGHLLPHYQAALEWQETVRHHCTLQSDAPSAHRQSGPSAVAWLRDLARRWRRQRRARPEAVAGRVTAIRLRTPLANGLRSS